MIITLIRRVGRVAGLLMRPSSLVISCLVGCIAPSACSESEKRGFVEWDSAGTRIAESSSPAWPDSNAWQVDANPILTIGDGSSPSVSFNNILQVLRLSDGRLLIDEVQEPSVRLFDNAGKLGRTIGRAGGGPGEFRFVWGVAVLGQDTLVAFDPLQQRLSLFDTAGSLIATVRMLPAPPHQLSRYRLIGICNRKLVLVGATGSGRRRLASDTFWDTVPNLLYSLTGSFTSTVGEPSGIDLFDTGTRFGGRLFGRSTSAALGDGVLFITDGGHLSIRSYLMDGRLKGIMRIPVPQRQVTAEELAAIPEEVRRSRFAAEQKPWISGLVVSEGGDLWVQEYQMQGDKAGARWYVFDGAGRWLGVVKGPPHFKLTNVTASSLFGIRTGPFGVEEVHEYSLHRRN